MSKEREFFQELIDEAWEKCRLADSYHLRLYLSHLFEKFLKPDAKTMQLLVDEPLALEFLERSQWGGRYVLADHRLGDIALFTAGLYSPEKRVRRMGVDYYASIAATLYLNVGRLARNPDVSELFYTLSKKTDECVQALLYISRTHLHVGELDELLAEYNKTRRAEDLNLLQRHGVHIIEPPDEEKLQ